MNLEQKIDSLEKLQEKLISQSLKAKIEMADNYYTYIDRIISLQDTLLSLRRRKSFIEQNYIKRGDYE